MRSRLFKKPCRPPVFRRSRGIVMRPADSMRLSLFLAKSRRDVFSQKYTGVRLAHSRTQAGEEIEEIEVREKSERSFLGREDR